MSSWFVRESRAYPGGDCCKAGYGEGAQKEVRDMAEKWECLGWGLKGMEEGAKLKISQTERLVCLRQEINSE